MIPSGKQSEAVARKWAKIASRMTQIKSWTVSDELWAKVGPLVPGRQRPEGRRYRRKPGAGRKPMAARRVFSAIVYVLRTGCQWKALPKEYGSASAVHQHFQNWQKAGFFLKLWQAGLVEYDGMEGIAWEWQSIEGHRESAAGCRVRGAEPHGPGKKMGANEVC